MSGALVIVEDANGMQRVETLGTLRCPCRACSSARYGLGYFGFMSQPSADQRLESARSSFLDEPIGWGPQLYTVEWFEREVDEILGVSHQRYMTARMREEIPPLTSSATAATVDGPTRD